MQLRILNTNQSELLPYLSAFKRKFYLVGGTAIALHLGHRRSIDFDLYTHTPIVKNRLKQTLSEIPFPQKLIFEDTDQLHVFKNEVKLTFFHYPFPIKTGYRLNTNLKFPDLLTLASMKAYALGRRSKWKDYVDLYFIIKYHYSIADICTRSTEIFGDQFSEKLFRQQLAFHKDIDYSEAVEYLTHAPEDAEIRSFLVGKSVDFIEM